jgi:hypothetical protein
LRPQLIFIEAKMINETESFLLQLTGGAVQVQIPLLAKLLNINLVTLRNNISQKKFPIRTFVLAGRRYAYVQDVARWLDAARVGIDVPPPKLGRPTKLEQLHRRLAAKSAESVGGEK